MFDRIAPRYDRLNRAMTAGLDGRWRQAAAAAADLSAGDRALDCCTGTGDLAFALADRVTPSGEVVGVDFSEQMLALARDKAAAARRRPSTSGSGDALALPFADDSFDAATVAFGIRNVVRPRPGHRRDGAGGAARRAGRDPRDHHAGAAAALLRRLVRPGGAPAGPPARAATAPPTPTCRRRCAGSPSRRSWPARMAAAGLTDVRWRGLAGGIIALHHGRPA